MGRFDDTRYVELACRKVRETDNAILCDFGDKEEWIPLSQIEEMEFNKHNDGSIKVAEWLANKKGLL